MESYNERKNILRVQEPEYQGKDISVEVNYAERVVHR